MREEPNRGTYIYPNDSSVPLTGQAPSRPQSEVMISGCWLSDKDQSRLDLTCQGEKRRKPALCMLLVFQSRWRSTSCLLLRLVTFSLCLSRSLCLCLPDSPSSRPIWLHSSLPLSLFPPRRSASPYFCCHATSPWTDFYSVLLLIPTFCRLLPVPIFINRSRHRSSPNSRGSHSIFRLHVSCRELPVLYSPTLQLSLPLPRLLCLSLLIFCWFFFENLASFFFLQI